MHWSRPYIDYHSETAARPMPPATTSAIPLTNLSQQQPQTTNHAPSTFAATPLAPSSQLVMNVSPSSNSTPPNIASTGANVSAPARPLAHPRTTASPQSWRGSFRNSISLANGLGTIALVAAFVFGIGAWVGMKIQISQGGQNMELAIWTTCADHQMIQNSTLCQSIMAKDFSDLVTRNITPEKKTLVWVKRDLGGSDSLGPGQRASSLETHYTKLMSSISTADRSLIEAKDGEIRVSDYYSADPAIRATIFPLVHLLTRPLQWIFDFIELILLLIFFCIHKILSWMDGIFIFFVQACLYGLVAQFITGLLPAGDAAIWAVMPSWMPYLLVSRVASLLGMSALRCFWYDTNYLQSLKWNFIVRMGVRVVGEGCEAGHHLWNNRNWSEMVVSRRRAGALSWVDW